jgi:glyoxylase-like metal-dependent hydrolase (beta-lactamase superfamily II)
MIRARVLLCLCLASFSSAVLGQEPDVSQTQIHSTALGGPLYLVNGAGGNLAALLGSDGVLLVDADFGALAEKITAHLRSLGASAAPRFIIDTHYHFDHTDGNAAFAAAGATLIATGELRSRLSTGSLIGNGGAIKREQPPYPPAGLPLITYEDELTLHVDGEEVRVHHYPHAHTDGDSVVFFTDAKLVHMGDIYVRYGFPFIDTNGGGNVRGMIAACEDVASHAPEGTRIIPGHGEVASVAELREYTQMLKDTSALVQHALERGETLEQMQHEQLLGAFSERYAPPKAFVDTAAFTESLYHSLAPLRPRHGPVRHPSH